MCAYICDGFSSIAADFVFDSGCAGFIGGQEERGIFIGNGRPRGDENVYASRRCGSGVIVEFCDSREVYTYIANHDDDDVFINWKLGVYKHTRSLRVCLFINSDILLRIDDTYSKSYCENKYFDLNSSYNINTSYSFKNRNLYHVLHTICISTTHCQPHTYIYQL